MKDSSWLENNAKNIDGLIYSSNYTLNICIFNRYSADIVKIYLLERSGQQGLL